MDLDVGDFDDRDFDDGEFSRWGDYECVANQYIEPKWPIVLTPLAAPLRKQATQPTRKSKAQPNAQAAFTTRSPVKTVARPQLLQPIAEISQSSLTSSEELDDSVAVPEPQLLYRSQSTNAVTTTLFPSEYDPAKEPPLSLLVIMPTQFNWSSTTPTLRQALKASVRDCEPPDSQPLLMSDSTITKAVNILESRVLACDLLEVVASPTPSTVGMATRPAENRLPQLKNPASEEDGGRCYEDISEIRAQLAALVRASREKAWVHEDGTRERSPLLRLPSTRAVISRLPRNAKPTTKTRLKAVDAHAVRHRRQSLAETPTVDSQYFALSAPRRQSLDGTFAAIEYKDDTYEAALVPIHFPSYNDRCTFDHSFSRVPAATSTSERSEHSRFLDNEAWTTYAATRRAQPNHP